MSRHTYYPAPLNLPCSLSVGFRMKIDATAAESYLKRVGEATPPTATLLDLAAAVLTSFVPTDLAICGIRALSIYPDALLYTGPGLRLKAEVVDLLALATAAMGPQENYSNWELSPGELVHTLIVEPALRGGAGLAMQSWADDEDREDLPGFEHLKPRTDVERQAEEVVIGWDPPLGTYYAQVFSSPAAERPLLWLGTRPRAYQTLDQLLQVLPPRLHPDAQLRAVLAADRGREGNLMDTGRPFDRIGKALGHEAAGRER